MRIRRKWARRVAWLSGGFLLSLALFYWWVPWEIRVPFRELKNLPRRDADAILKAKRVAVVTAHPDDAEFYVAGTLLQLGDAAADIQLIVCTDGDKSYYPFENWQRNIRIRRQEQSEAARKWHGREPVYLGFKDGRYEPTDELIQAVQRELERAKPDIVLCFDPEYPPRLAHGDHRKSGVAAAEAARRLELRTAYFSTARPNCFIDVDRVWDRRWDALWTHRSQFVVPGRIRSMIESRDRANGWRTGSRYAESFYLAR